jgi:hypothetical protein
MFMEERDEKMVQFDEWLMMEFFPGFGKGAFCNDACREILGSNSFEEVVQLVLNGTFYEIDEEENHFVEGQQPIPDKIFF